MPGLLVSLEARSDGLSVEVEILGSWQLLLLFSQASISSQHARREEMLCSLAI